jgi:N-glycosylase/DNA lyase
MESPSKNILITFKRYLKNSKSNMNKKRKRKTPKTARAATFHSNLEITSKKISKPIKLFSKEGKA